MTKQITFRAFDFSDADYELAIDISNRVWPDDLETVDEWKHRDKNRKPEDYYRSHIAYVGELPVAISVHMYASWSADPNFYFALISAVPGHDTPELYDAYFALAQQELLQHEPTILLTAAREDHVNWLNYVQSIGFEIKLREPQSQLSVPDFDWETFEGLPAKVAATGLKLTTVAELAEPDDAHYRKLHALAWEILQDVPTSLELKKQPYDEWYKRTISRPTFDPTIQFIAVDGDRWVGMSQLYPSLGDDSKYYTALTGVARSHRRRNVATALKVMAINCARKNGRDKIVTDNEENNPMYGLNMQLGFKPQPAWVSLQRPFEENEG